MSRGGYIFRIGKKVERVHRGSCDDCRWVGPGQREKEAARQDLLAHRIIFHKDRPLDPRDERPTG